MKFEIVQARLILGHQMVPAKAITCQVALPAWISGRGVTKNLVSAQTLGTASAQHRGIVRDMQQNLCKVASDPCQSMQEKPEELMDGLSRQESSSSKLLKHPQRQKSQGQGLGGRSSAAPPSAGSKSSPTPSEMGSCWAGFLLSKLSERLLKELQAGDPSTACGRAVSARGWMCSM